MHQQIRDYITENQDKSSRYEIDLYLIQSNFEPREIEAVWQSLQSNQLTPKKKSQLLSSLIQAMLFIASLILLGLAFVSLIMPAFYELHAIAGSLRPGLILIALLILAMQAWWNDAKKQKNHKLSFMSLLLVPCLCLFASFLLFVAIIFGKSWTVGAGANVVAGPYSYRFLTNSEESCSWEDCRVTFELYRCDTHNLFCPIYDGLVYYNTDFRNDAKSGDIRLSLDPVTNKVQLLNGDTILYTFKT